MGNKPKKKRNKLGKKLKADIFNFFVENPTTQFNYKQVAGFLDISDKALRILIFEILSQLVEEGKIKETVRGKFKLAANNKLIEGKVDVAKSGVGYLISDDLEEDLFLPKKELTHVLNGDLVKVAISKGGRGKKNTGRVVEVLDRNERVFVGTLDVQSKHAFLILDDPKIDRDIFIPKEKLRGGKSGEKATVRISDWPASAKNPFGEILQVLGDVESIDTQMKAILIAYGIANEFPEKVIEESNNISIVLDDAEILKRRDFRNVLTFTIDPLDAKDFDDAISLEILENGNVKLGVHIADVSHYVKPGSALDLEAYNRGNSVYLVDRVIPMLPEHLSNGVCSLRPNEEKFCFSAEFELSMEGTIVSEWFGKTVIKSDRRYTYEEAQEVIETQKGELVKEILLVDQLAKTLRKARLKHGGLEITSAEIRFELNEEGMPINVYKKTSKDANKLIEEFMLLANKRVGEFVGDTKRKTTIPLIYRIHDQPDREKVEQFRVFVSKFGKNFIYKDENDIARQMNNLFAEMKDDGNFAMIQQMAIKSMAKAVYDTENIGHYGLGFRYYAHFTSPIRRYADLMVHRVLFDVLQNKQQRHANMQETAKHISITERRAVEAERASKKFFQAEYLKDQIGERFTGFITGLTDWGMYVEMNENHCEGMVTLKSIPGDRYFFDEKSYAVIGNSNKMSFNIGDRVEVVLTRVSLVKKQIDLELVI